MSSNHADSCECMDCYPLDHTKHENGHESGCFCDICKPDRLIGFTSCTCDECDPEGLGIYCRNINQDQLDLEKIKKCMEREHGNSCNCLFCDYLFCDASGCDTRAGEDSVVIACSETARRIIEIRKEQHGYSTSAISKIDSFTSETIFSIDLEEAEDELKKYKLEDEGHADSPPELQKKLYLIECASEDEGDEDKSCNTTPEIRDTIGHRITKTYHDNGIYTVSAARLSDMQEVDTHIIDSPGTATLVVQDFVEKYH